VRKSFLYENECYLTMDVSHSEHSDYGQSYINDRDFEGEFIYTLTRSLRGSHSGRRFKRTLFKFGFILLVCGFALLTITCLIEENFKRQPQYATSRYGSDVLTLMFCTSVLANVFAIVTLLAVRYWGSLVTNRDLLVNLFKIYSLVLLVAALIGIWTLMTNVLTFTRIKDWGENVTLARMYPYWVCTCIFLCPLLAAMLYFFYQIITLVKEIEDGENIVEPNANIFDNMDLADVTVGQAIIMGCSLPLIFLIQVVDFCAVVQRDLTRKWKKISSTSRKSYVGISNIGRHLYRNYFKIYPVRYEADLPDAENIYESHGSDYCERNITDTCEREKVERLSRQSLQNAGARKLHEAKLMGESKLDFSTLKEEFIDIESANFMSTPNLGIKEYKELWMSFHTTKYFQRAMNMKHNLSKVISHLLRKGLHILYTVGASSEEDIEMAICYSDGDKTGLFLARILITHNSFSAVFKGTNEADINSAIYDCDFEGLMEMILAATVAV